MNTKPIRMSRKDRQTQILEAALNVFVEKGYNGATTAEIAKAAKISEVTLFRNFDSKKDIFKLAVEPIVVTTLKESIKASENLSKNDQVKHILVERVKLVSKNSEVIKLVLMESQINEELADVNYIETMSHILSETIVDFGLKVENKDLVSRMLMGSILSFLYIPEVDDLKIESFVDSFLSILIEKSEN